MSVYLLYNELSTKKEIRTYFSFLFFISMERHNIRITNKKIVLIYNSV